jgi:hypothetical protein
MNSAIRCFYGATACFAALAVAGCAGDTSSADGQAGLEAMNQQLAARVQRLEDMFAIQKVQAKYTHYLFTQDFAKIVDECFAKRAPDVSVEFSDSGVYRGLDSIRKLYAAFEATKQIPGFFIMHTVVTPYIEIAADGQSAKAHWLSPGAVGNANSASWVWGPYYVDYAKEDGEWRILHTNLAALFRNRYEVSWAKAEDHGTVRGILEVEPDEPSTVYRPYSELKNETDIFKNHPDLPAPY